MAILIPSGIMLLMQWRIRSFWDAHNGIIGLLYSHLYATLIGMIIKVRISHALFPYNLLTFPVYNRRSSAPLPRRLQASHPSRNSWSRLRNPNVRPQRLHG